MAQFCHQKIEFVVGMQNSVAPQIAASWADPAVDRRALKTITASTIAV
jgi:hypothetical protein